MARLPEPITEGLQVKWPERSEYEEFNKVFLKMIGQSISKAELSKEKEDDDKER